MREQVADMTLNAETNARLANEYKELVAEHRKRSEREIQKLKLMFEVFSMGERLLLEKKESLQKEETEVEEYVFGAIDDAISNMAALSKQAQEQVVRNEGALGAFQGIEEVLTTRAQKATARARGMDIQGARAVGVAERRGPAPELQEAPQSAPQAPVMASSQGPLVSGFLDTKPSGS